MLAALPFGVGGAGQFDERLVHQGRRGKRVAGPLALQVAGRECTQYTYGNSRPAAALSPAANSPIIRVTSGSSATLIDHTRATIPLPQQAGFVRFRTAAA